jgi:ribosomal protein L35
MRRHAMQSHNLGKKSAKRKRAFSNEFEVAGNDTSRVKKLLGVK